MARPADPGSRRLRLSVVATLAAVCLLGWWLWRASDPDAPANTSPLRAADVGRQGDAAVVPVAGTRREPVDVGENAPPAPASTTGRLTDVRLRIVDPAGAPVAGADVVWGDETAVARARLRIDAARRRGEGSPEAMSLPDRLRAIGVAVQADERGEVQVSCQGEHLFAMAWKGELAAQQRFAVPADGGDLVLVLARGDTLRVRVVDDARSPIAQVPVVASWPSALQPGTAREAFSPLGATDADGELTFAGWRAFHHALCQHVPGLDGHLRVAPGWAGGEESAVAVAEAALHPVVIAATPPVACSVRLFDATGQPLAWSGLVLDVRSPGASVASTCVLQQGVGTVLLGPGRTLQWSVRGFEADLGGGTIVSGPRELDLHCADVIEVTGICPADAAAHTLHVEYGSRVRPAGDQAIGTSEHGRFRLQVARADLGRSVVFRRGDQAATVYLPPTSRNSLDLGVLTFATPAARLRVVGGDGSPLPGAIVSLTTIAGAPIAGVPVETAAIRRCGPAEFEVLASTPASSWTLHVTSPGHLARMVEVMRGSDALVRLEAVAPRRVQLQLAAGTPGDDIWLRLRERLDAGSWRPVELTFEHWARARSSSDGAFVEFPDAPAGRYRCEALSVRPVHTLAEVEIDLGLDAASTIDLLHVRSVAMRVLGPDGGDRPYVIAGSELRRDPDRQPLRLRQLAFGDQRWTLRADEREVWVVAAGLLPALAVPDQGGTVTCTAVAGVLPESAAEVLRPRSPWLHERRPAHRYEPDAARMARALARWQDLPGGAPLWPCDYEVRVAGVPRVAAWTGSGWRLVD